jgi:hypothetical protein
MPVIDAEDCVDNLSVVFEIDQYQARALLPGTVEIQYLVPFVGESLHDAPAELSASACDNNSHL